MSNVNFRDLPPLVERAKRGDERAFEAMLRISEPYAYHKAFQILRCHNTTEDAVQEARITAWRKLGNLQDPLCFPQWLARTAMNYARHAAYRKREFPTDDPYILHSAVLDPLDEVNRRAISREVWLTLEGLPQHQREVLAGAIYEIPQAIFATHFGICQGAVKSRTLRAKVAFSKVWRERNA